MFKEEGTDDNIDKQCQVVTNPVTFNS